MTVYDLLFPADERYKGMAHLAVLNKQKEMKSLGGCYYADLQQRIDNLTIMKSRNYYITANATIPFSRRCSNNLLFLSNIVLDFDIHKRMNQDYREELIEEFIWRIKRDLFNIPEPFRLCAPNVLHRTSRGVQMWFHINSASAKLLWLYQKTVDGLVVIFRELISDYPNLEKHITIDVAASKNGCGLYRLFNSWNTHTGKQTEVEILHTNSIDLNDLFQNVCEHDAVKRKIQQAELNAAQYQKRRDAGKKSSQTKRQGNSYDALHRKRLAFIKWWDTQQTDSIGKRDLMLYLAFNACIQLMTREEGMRWCEKLNREFSEPLKDITYIFKEIKKPFQIRNTVFYGMLGVDPADVCRFETEYSKTSMNQSRNEAIKKRKMVREQKKAQAQKMIMDGLPYKEIAQSVGLSLSAIKKLATTTTVRKKLPKPWDELGISKSTYYRRLKNDANE